MKSIVLLSALILAGCSKEIKKESCTYNGKSLPCKDMPNRNQESISPNGSSLKGRILKSEITSAIAINTTDRRIDFLESDFNEEVVSSQLEDIKCGMEINAGDEATYTLIGSSASVKMLGERMRLTRLTGNKQSIIGSWEQVVYKNQMRQVSLINISEDRVNVKLTCTIL